MNFRECLIKVLKEMVKNTEFELSSASMRTIIMLGVPENSQNKTYEYADSILQGKGREKSAVYKAALQFFEVDSFHKEEYSNERYADFIVKGIADGEDSLWENSKKINKVESLDSNDDFHPWWQGNTYNKLVVEVENNICEFKGTISDLLNIKAKKKVAIFYADNPNLEQYSKYAQSVIDKYKNQYKDDNSSFKGLEVIFLPENIANVNDDNIYSFTL